MLHEDLYLRSRTDIRGATPAGRQLLAALASGFDRARRNQNGLIHEIYSLQKRANEQIEIEHKHDKNDGMSWCV